MTRADHETGTDRLAEVAAGLDAPIIVNIQGDEPLIEGWVIDAAVQRVAGRRLTSPMATVVHPAEPERARRSEPREGGARSPRPRALLLAQPRSRRCATPAPRRAIWQHVGLYAYRRAFLLDFVKLAPHAARTRRGARAAARAGARPSHPLRQGRGLARHPGGRAGRRRARRGAPAGARAMLTAVLLGFVLGLRHAFDPDHVIAVSTIVARHRSVWTASWIGVVLGHRPRRDDPRDRRPRDRAPDRDPAGLRAGDGARHRRVAGAARHRESARRVAAGGDGARAARGLAARELRPLGRARPRARARRQRAGGPARAGGDADGRRRARLSAGVRAGDDRRHGRVLARARRPRRAALGLGAASRAGSRRERASSRCSSAPG